MDFIKKIDYKRELKDIYKPSHKVVSLLNVPALNYLMIEGSGNPNTSADYADAVEALYSLSYAIKFNIKKSGLAIDYGVMPLEGLWWVENMAEFDVNNKDKWIWTSMIMQPEIVTKKLFEDARTQVKAKKNPKALSKIRFDTFEEGKCVQIMHIGPFSEEGPTIEKLHNHIKENKWTLSGKHHEVYLSDIRRADPAKWKTIIRQPYSL